VGDGTQYGFRRAFKEVGQAHEEFAAAQADRIVHVSEREEFHLQLGH
jgi:hypothetical protein